MSMDDETKKQVDTPEVSATSVYTCPRTPERIVYHSPSKQDEASCSKLNVNERLQVTLEKHGIAKQSAGDFLLGLLKDKEFKNLVRANLDDDDSSDEESSGVRMTRSKLKEVMRNSPFKAPWTVSPTEDTVKEALPKFTEIPLPENDDDDDEYKPRDSSFASDTQDQSYSEFDNKSRGTEATENIDTEENLVLDIPEDDVFKELNEAPSKNSDDIISKRTRSKHSLQSTSLNVLEAAFDPPDASADMYETTNIFDYDWQKWLSDLMNDNEGNENVAEEDDTENDPDFNFNPELDKPDEEDMKDDSSVRVSKKELYGLLDEIENVKTSDWPAVSYVAGRLQPDRKKKRKSRDIVGMPEWPRNTEIPMLELSSSQVELVTQQLQQHVQLLAQTNLLCRNQSDFEEFVAESKELLLELKDISQSQIDRLRIEKSFLTPWNFEEALRLSELEILPSKPCVRLLRTEKMKRHVPVAKRIAEIMGNSKAFMYKELLPISAPTSKFQQQKMAFLPSEDCLLTLGVAEMAAMPDYFELISNNMLPTKTSKQIAARFRNVTYCRNSKDAVNPIFRYRTNGTLPKPNKRVKYVFQHTAKKPVDMKGTLPCWVLSLKPMQPEESSDDSVSNWSQPHIQSTPHNTRALSICNNQVITVSPVKAIMIPYIAASVYKAMPTVPLSQITVFQTPTTLDVQTIISKPAEVHMTVPSMKTIQSSSPPIHHVRQEDVTSTSNTLKTTPTAQVQTSILYGQRKSAGKSIRRLTESREERMVSPPSSSSSDDEEVLETAHTRHQSSKEKAADVQLEEDIQPNESEDNHSIDSEDERSDHEGISTVKKTAEKIVQVETVGSKSVEDAKILPAGGFLQKAHPRLSGRKTKSGIKDATRLHLTAKMVRSLEEETIVQLDPKRTEKEKIFASGYLERVENTLKNDPDVFKAFLDILVTYSDGTKSPVDLHAELSQLLGKWPELVQSLAPFLMPEQAQECGLNTEQEVYARARKFLRQLEIQFGDNPEHMEKILNVFHTVAETAIYREEELMKSILTLLKDYPYLQDEFLTFFDNQPPPKALFDEDFEEVDFSDELLKDPTLNQCEQVNLMPENIETSDPHTSQESHRRPKRRRISLGLNEGSKSPVKSLKQGYEENKESMCTELVNLEEEEDFGNTDYESEDAMEEVPAQTDGPEKTFTSVPPPITVINEDAISSSPFKRITAETSRPNPSLRPLTPTGLKSDNTRSISPSTSPTETSIGPDELVLAIPVTPGKDLVMPSAAEICSQQVIQDPQPPTQEDPQSAEEHQHPTDALPANIAGEPPPEDLNPVPDEDQRPLSAKGNSSEPVWTRQADELILTSCQRGVTPEMFSEVAEKLNCGAAHVESRLNLLLQLFNGSEADSQGSEEDSDIVSDSSAT